MHQVALLALLLFTQPAPQDQQKKTSQTVPAMQSFIVQNTPNSHGKRIVDDPNTVAFLQNALGRVLFTDSGAVIGVMPPSEDPIAEGLAKAKNGGKGSNALVYKVGVTPAHAQKRRVSPTVEEPLSGKVNYFIGTKENWRSSVPTYSKIVYDQLWDGITLEYHTQATYLGTRLIVAPGADLAAVQLETGSDELRVSKSGSIDLQNQGHGISLDAPVAYQLIDGKRVTVPVAYQVTNGKLGFQAASKTQIAPLVIEQQVIWTMGDGTQDQERAMAIGVDGTDAAIVTGYTYSQSFPVTSGVVDTAHNGEVDIFVAKVSTSGNDVLYATYFGGSGSDWATGIAVDDQGAAYVCGTTTSSNFPVTSGAYDTSANGQGDAFVFKLNPAGSAVEFATYVGGADDDVAQRIALNADGQVFLTGYTSSSDYPTDNGFDTTLGGTQDGFTTQLNQTGTALLYSTYLGGSAEDSCADLFVDSTGTVFGTGSTASTDFPVTAGVLDATFNGSTDAFIYKLDSTGANLTYATYLGGPEADEGTGIVVDASGQATVVGVTESTLFPTHEAYDEEYGGNKDVFVTKVNADATGLVFSTFLGGSQEDVGTAITSGSDGKLTLTGYSSSSNYPTTAGAYRTTYSGSTDVIISQLSAEGGNLLFSSFIAGSGVDKAQDIDIDSTGSFYITGYEKPASSDERVFVSRIYSTGTALRYYKNINGDTASTHPWGDVVFSPNGDMYAAYSFNGWNLASIFGGEYQEGIDMVLSVFDYTLSWKHNTFIGGSRDDKLSSIHINDNQEIFIGCQTNSPDYPLTFNAYSSELYYNKQTAISILTNDNLSLTYSTLISHPTASPPILTALSSGLIIFTDSMSGNTHSSSKIGQISILNTEAKTLHSRSTGEFSNIKSLHSNKQDSILISGAIYQPEFMPSTAGVFWGNLGEWTGFVAALNHDLTTRDSTYFPIAEYPWDGLFANFQSTYNSTNNPLIYGSNSLTRTPPLTPGGNSAGNGYLLSFNPYFTDLITSTRLVVGTILELEVDDSSQVYILSDSHEIIKMTPDGLTVSQRVPIDIQPEKFALSPDKFAYVGGRISLPNGIHIPAISKVDTSCDAPLITDQPSNTTKCPGESTSFSVTTTGTQPFTYQWRKNGEAISGATASTYTLPTVAAADAAEYFCVITNSCGSTTSLAATLTVRTPVALTASPSSALRCAGEPLSFSVSATGTGPLTYQWYRDGALLPGATASTLSFSALTSDDTGDYVCTVSNRCNSVSSPAATVTVGFPITFSEEPTDQVVCSSVTTLSVAASGGVNLTYQWFKDGFALSGATQAELALTQLGPEIAGGYACRVTSDCGSVFSRTAQITFPFSIVSQPQDQAVCFNQEISLSVSAQGSDPLSYQWSRDGIELPLATSATYTIPASSAEDRGTYTCRVSNGLCDVTSASATVTVDPLTLSDQPQGAALCVGADLTLSLGAEGEPNLVYQWFKDGQPLPGATSADLLLTDLQVSQGGSYTCAVTGSCSTLVSDPAVVQVAEPISLLSQSRNDERCVGQNIQLHVSAQGSDLRYNWLRDGNPLDQTQATLDLTNLQPSDAGTYTCAISNDCGTVSSDPIRLQVHSVAIGSFQISVPTLPTAAPGSTVQIPLTLLNTESTQVSAYTVSLDYDPDLLRFLSAETQLTLSDGWLLSANDSAGQVQVSASSSQAFDTGGTLLTLSFQVTEDLAQDTCTPITPVALQINEGAYCAAFQEGSLCLCAKGDVTGNDMVQAFDAHQILRHSAGLPTPFDPLDPCVADTTCNGTISALDASQVLKYTVNLISGFCTGESFGARQNPLLVSLADQTVSRGSRLELPIQIDTTTGAGVESVQLMLSYDPDVLVIDGLDRSGTLLDAPAWDVVLNTTTPGQIQLSAAGIQPLSGAGTLVRLLGQTRRAGQTTLAFSQTSLNEGQPVALTQNARLRVRGVQLAPQAIPMGFDPVTFTVTELCCDATGLTWHDEQGNQLGSGESLTIDTAPPTTRRYEVRAQLPGAKTTVSDSATLLVPENSQWSDPNNDGTNSLEDLQILLPDWNRSGQDANGDGMIDIRDYLFIPIGPQTPATPARNP